MKILKLNAPVVVVVFSVTVTSTNLLICSAPICVIVPFVPLAPSALSAVSLEYKPPLYTPVLASK